MATVVHLAYHGACFSRTTGSIKLKIAPLNDLDEVCVGKRRHNERGRLIDTRRAKPVTIGERERYVIVEL
jgi:hypothetical protein